MKTTEIVSRCLKARVVSWLTVSQQAVVMPSVDGSGCILAVYDNGRYMQPELVRIPDGVPPGWGPDGPLQRPDDGDAPADDDDNEEQ